MDYKLVFSGLWDFVIRLAQMMADLWNWLNTEISVLGLHFTPILISLPVIIVLIVWGLAS